MSYSIRATRIVLSNLIFYLISWYCQIPEKEWGLITIWFIMYDYTFVGGVWLKSWYRFLGTLFSALYGLSIIYFFYNDVVINMLAFIPPIFIYAYFFMDTERSYIALIGGVTLSIVLLNHNDIAAAILRVYNVFLGILMSMFMIRFFYPQYAQDEMLKTQSEILSRIEKPFDAFLDSELLIEELIAYENANQVELNRLVPFFEKSLKETQFEIKMDLSFWAAYQKELWIIHNIIGLTNTFIHHIITNELRSEEPVKNQIRRILNNLSSIQQALDSINQVTKNASRIEAIKIELEPTTEKITNLLSENGNASFVLTCIEQEIDALAYESGIIVSFYQE